jgi:protein involved in polysaccharide export with SLBB domain
MVLGLRFLGSALVFGRKFGQVLSKPLIGLSLMASCALTAAQGLGGLGVYGGASLQGLNPQMPASGLAGGVGGGLPGAVGANTLRPDSGGGTELPDLTGGESPGLASVIPKPAELGLVASKKILPLQPNEFQKFVLQTTGQATPLFGSSFFENTLNQLTDPNRLAVGDDYTVGVGDELLIRIWGSINMDTRVTVDRRGEIALPRLGTTRVAGLKATQIEPTVRALLAQNYKDFKVSVVPGRLRRITVYVVGQARNPGSYTLNSESTLTSGLFASGGPNPSGSIRRVQLMRHGNVIAEFDLYSFLSRGDKSSDIRLLDGDVLVYPKAIGHLALVGKVNSPGVFEIKDATETLGDFLNLAGGMPAVADPRRATLERLSPGAPVPRRLEEFALGAQGLKKSVTNGDVFSVLPIVPELANVVTLRGSVAQPARFAWKPGMRVSDIITDYSVLKSAESVRRQNELLFDGFEQERALRARIRVPTDLGLEYKVAPNGLNPSESLLERIGKPIEEVNLDYAVVERVEPQGLRVSVLPFSIGNLLADPASPDNLILQAGDIITVFSNSDLQIPQGKRRIFVRIEGEVNRPGVYQVMPGERLVSLLKRAGGPTADSYLYGLSMFRESVKQSQRENLDKIVRAVEQESAGALSAVTQSVGASADALAFQARNAALQRTRLEAIQRLKAIRPEGRISLNLKPDPTLDISAIPDLQLAFGDRIVVPVRPDFVYVFGAVNTESALIYRRNADVASYLKVAGATAGADTDAIVLLRADGSAASSQASFWGNQVLKTVVMPGDTIVLPEKLDRESNWSFVLRNSKDITQTLFQLGLGAAALKTLRQ